MFVVVAILARSRTLFSYSAWDASTAGNSRQRSWIICAIMLMHCQTLWLYYLVQTGNGRMFVIIPVVVLAMYGASAIMWARLSPRWRTLPLLQLAALAPVLGSVLLMLIHRRNRSVI
jgi:hypothetical protein